MFNVIEMIIVIIISITIIGSIVILTITLKVTIYNDDQLKRISDENLVQRILRCTCLHKNYIHQYCVCMLFCLLLLTPIAPDVRQCKERNALPSEK